MNELIALNQVTVNVSDNSITPSKQLLLKAALIDSIEEDSVDFDGHPHSFSTITVGLCSNNPKIYNVYESPSEIAKKLERLN